MRILVGVGGGIAAYKAAELVRTLGVRGHEVQVAMTRAAGEFVRPLTFASLTGRKVITDLFSEEGPIEHIAAARDNDVLLVAPATADLMAKFACGLADDFLTTTFLAFTGKVVLAPAMNTAMWLHPATQANLTTLERRDCSIVSPSDGWLACREMGPGRLAEPAAIVEHVEALMRTKRDFDGENFLITAGPTQEALDPIRYISNRSSGKMGYAIADAAARRGANVVLVSGPVSLTPPPQVELVSVRTAQEMRKAVMDHLAEATIIVKSAAVADYYVASVPQQKLKKTAARLSLELDPTPDILAEVGEKKGDRLLVGFAAETENLVEEARRKMLSKHCDMLVANLVNREGLGFEADNNEVEIITRGGKTAHAGPAGKRQIAEQILDQIALLRLTLRAVDASA
ncbi:MAG TPA: bifunctional phosphopantothenoylcysteine decarboxylase/phosphopantothenate--cysteine ligase CoaBC [Bryobacteraceae bacterium]|jgi:phosphopantothenoylcysteine decarboxylase/phosphopantothenate--cysteine ligase